MIGGYYSLIRYCPCFQAQEFANIGLMIFTEAKSVFIYKLREDTEKIKRFFYKDNSFVESFNQAKRDFVSFLDSPDFQPYDFVRFQDYAVLAGFSDGITKYNHAGTSKITVAEPRFMRISDPQEDFDLLYGQLILDKI